MCFPVNFAKILRTPFFIKHLQWLLRILIYTTAGFIGNFYFYCLVTTAFQTYYVCLFISNKYIMQGQIFVRLLEYGCSNIVKKFKKNYF